MMCYIAAITTQRLKKCKRAYHKSVKRAVVPVDFAGTLTTHFCLYKDQGRIQTVALVAHAMVRFPNLNLWKIMDCSKYPNMVLAV